MTRLKLWWLCLELRRHRRFQREDVESSIVEADICRNLLRKINALTAPVKVEMTGPRVVR